jgi:hypothetical protein
MPAVKDAVGTVLKALQEDDWVVTRQQPVARTGPNPTEVDLRRGQEVQKLLLYAWTVTHEGEGRSGPNQRVQWTPNHVTAPMIPAAVPFKRGRLAMGVGWWPAYEVFFLFDVWTKRLAKWSASIHVTVDALMKAHAQQQPVVDRRDWDPRIALPWSKADEMIPWTRAQNQRREAVIRPVEPVVFQARKAKIVGHVWGRTATTYLRPGDDMVLINKRKKLIDDSVWRIDSLVPDTTLKPQRVTFDCHRASRITDPHAILNQFSA